MKIPMKKTTATKADTKPLVPMILITDTGTAHRARQHEVNESSHRLM